VLFVEQNLALVVSLAVRGAVIDKGRIVAARTSDLATWGSAIWRYERGQA
jgi:ABC-type branched-subunit amino acid transport system ATPase component